MQFTNDRVSVYALPESQLTSDYPVDIGTRYRDASLIELPGGEAWVFDYGVVVFWGIDEDERLSLLHRLKIQSELLAGGAWKRVRRHVVATTPPGRRGRSPQPRRQGCHRSVSRHWPLAACSKVDARMVHWRAAGR